MAEEFASTVVARFTGDILPSRHAPAIAIVLLIHLRHSHVPLSRYSRWIGKFASPSQCAAYMEKSHDLSSRGNPQACTV
jgi:hypothetical protein